MVDREAFDEWLRDACRGAAPSGCTGTFETITPRRRTAARVGALPTEGRQRGRQVRAQIVIGADGAQARRSPRNAVPGADAIPLRLRLSRNRPVAAAGAHDFDGSRCDVYYQGRLSPDFYGWVFPHGATASVGIGSARKGFSPARSGSRICGRPPASTRSKPCDAKARRSRCARCGAGTMAGTSCWPGDAAGVVAPASGEGIYYAMEGGRLAAAAADEFCATGDVPRAANRAQTLHASAWPCVLDPRHDAVVLVFVATNAASVSSAFARIPTCNG